MKMELIASLLHNPRVLFLDEPTIGLDAIAQRQIRELVQQVNREQGVSVLLTSHYMEDIRHLCDRVMIIREGRKIYDGRLDALLDRYKETMTVTLRFRSTCDWELPHDVVCVRRSPYDLVSRMARSRVQSFLNEALPACEVEDIRIDEEEIGDLVEKIYRLEGGLEPQGTRV